MPNQCNIIGDETADAVAKGASKLNPIRIESTSLSNAIKSINSNFTEIWIQQWITSNKEKHTSNLKTEIVTKQYIKTRTSRSNFWILNKNRTYSYRIISI